MTTELTLRQPPWLDAFLAGRAAPAGDAARLDEVLALATENVARGTGGPFAAAVYDEATGRRLAAAVNTVVASCCALAHAETQALGLAQQAAGSHTLADRPCVLVSSAEPCAMCTGAIAWSGIARLLYAATRADVEAAGFDEGPRPRDWRAQLARRGTLVGGPRRRARAQAVLQDYVARGGRCYNGRPRPAPSRAGQAPEDT